MRSDRRARVALLFLLGAAAAAIGCATPRPPFDYAAEPDPRRGGFLLGPSDVLKVNVWHNPDLSI
ncbi:MAG TPA: hypothetical protein VI456_01085, partial [Polyangia bacterium]